MPFIIDTKDHMLAGYGICFVSSTKDDGAMADRVARPTGEVAKNKKRFFVNAGLGEGEDVAHMLPCQGDDIITTTQKGFFWCDGLWTTMHSLPLALATADCYPVLLLNIWTQALALLHCGWRGAALHLPLRMIRRWGIEKGRRGTQAVHVFFGPGICGACYRVRNPQQLSGRVSDGDLSWSSAATLVGEDEYFIDIKKYMVDNLTSYGVPPENIFSDIAPCTRESPLFFSRRAGDAARFLTVGVKRG